MKCLVTGATGFTGGHLARRLAQDGHEVVALARPGSDTTGLQHAGIDVHKGQLTKRDDVMAAAAGVEKIYHIAAVFRTAGHSDDYYREVNVGGTLNVLEAGRKLGCERVVHCSTIGVHGHIEEPPATEEYRVKPGDIYQRTKLDGEREAEEAIKRGQPVSIFRPGSIYGEGDLRFLKLFKALQKRRFIMIGPGKVRLHLVHIDDLVAGIKLCGSKAEALGQTFILAGPAAATLNEIIAEAATAMGVAPPRFRVPVGPIYAAGWLCELVCVPLQINPPLHRRRVGFFTNHREFDISKARRVLGYDPRVSYREGLQRMATWYAEQGLIDPIPPMAGAA